MRILHLTAGTKWTGPAAVAVDQVAALREAGVEAELVITRDSPLAERLSSEGWVRPLLAPGRSPGQFLRDVAVLNETLSRERFDLVHSHSSHDHVIAAAALSAIRVPLVRSFHHENGFRSTISSWGRRRAAGFAFSNSALQSAFVSRFSPTVPCARFPPVTDLARFRPEPREPGIRKEFGVPAHAFAVGTIGKMAARRGHDIALRVLAATQDPKIVLVQVGKGPWKERLWDLARSLGVAERNFGTGYQEERLPALYRAMDAFLFTASGADQGHRAALEAMASGLPVVALDLPGIVDLELVKGPGLVAQSEIDASEALDFLASHPKEREAMSGAARRQAERFSGASFSAAAGDFYSRVLDSWKNTHPRRVTIAREEQ